MCIYIYIYGDVDIWIFGHQIQSGIFRWEVDIEFKMENLDPGLFWSQDPAPWTQCPGDLGTRTCGPTPRDPDPGTRGPGPKCYSATWECYGLLLCCHSASRIGFQLCTGVGGVA